MSDICAPAGAALRDSVPLGNQGVRIAKAIPTDPGDSVPLTREASLPERHGEF